MGKSIADVCDELDRLSIRMLELMEEKITTNVQMERSIREGHMELAKARYIRGKESIGMLQVPQDDRMTSLFDVETTTTTRTAGRDVPSFDVGLKTAKSGDEKPDDPIRWFGLLVPRNLRAAQKRFQESVYLAAKAATVGAELECIPGEIERLRRAKGRLED